MGLLPHGPSPIEIKGLRMCGRSRMQVLRAKAANQRDQSTAGSPTIVSQLGQSILGNARLIRALQPPIFEACLNFDC